MSAVPLQAVPKAPAAKLDTAFISAFVKGALETLKVQCSLTAVAGKPFQKGKGDEVNVNIAGVIAVTCDAFKGSLAIEFPEATYLKVMGGMLGETYEQMTDDLRDGAAELTNIIFGCAKKLLSEQGYKIDRAIPSVVQGEKIKILHAAKTPIVVIPFTSNGGPFQIEIVLD